VALAFLQHFDHLNNVIDLHLKAIQRCGLFSLLQLTLNSRDSEAVTSIAQQDGMQVILDSMQVTAVFLMILHCSCKQLIAVCVCGRPCLVMWDRRWLLLVS